MGIFFALVIALLSGGKAYAQGYDFQVETQYNFGTQPGIYNNYGQYSGNPDTGWVTITNNGSSDFNGTIGVYGNYYSGDQANNYNLAPGQSIELGLNTESSNQGGYNPGGWNNWYGYQYGPQSGAQVYMNGLVNGSEYVNLSVYDSQIQSGSYRWTGTSWSDSYVLQGGDPYGNDTGDGFEVTQAPGFYTWSNFANTPEPATFVLFGTLIGAAILRRRQTGITA